MYNLYQYITEPISFYCSSDAVASKFGRFNIDGSQDQQILLDEVRCTGRETSFLDCSFVHISHTDHDCNNHAEDAGVICEGMNKMRSRSVAM